ncbi:ferritin-like domain-containing protein [Hymenobacter cheonanensis]|uniref:ferritin-like domain-containing protein n=1 Tax=Hymenobacter sp. CA2-7 TaxID=3063993 RepID=UPI002713AF40|nr:ferritin-like domain-containing protein [Hymenobacter sp. CA2-7]MDO7885227.1 ferritin-like domain-containing protein [Hymenobacter sp. CA2-7]
MTLSLPAIRVRPAAAGAPTRRSFLRYSGASAVLGSLWLASCKGNQPDPSPTAVTSLASFSPASGMAGTVVTLKGTGFLGTTALRLGTTTVTGFTVVDAATITFSVPAGAQTGAISVTSPTGTATSSTQFTVTATPATAPTITSFSPASALPGTLVTATGTNFTGATSLTVNGLAATPTVTSATTLTFTVPTAAAAGLATVVVTGPGGMGTNNTAFTVLPSTVSVGTGDAGVLNYAYALEQLEAAFYTQVRTGTYYTGLATNGAERLAFDDLYYHEVIHREFLKAALTAAGVTPLKDLTVDFTSINFSDRTSVLNTAKAFEDLGVAAYNGVAQYIVTPAYLYLAGKIVSVEARHAALIRDFVSEGTFVGNDVVTISTAGTSSVATNNGPAGSSLERALAPAEVVAVANAYLAIGSRLDVSGIK